MDRADFRKLVRNLTEEDITADEPHVSMRCRENGIPLAAVKRILLHGHTRLLRITEDRPQVYKLYYRWGRRAELKIVIDTVRRQKINIRTVKRLDAQFRLPRMDVMVMIEGDPEGEDLNITTDWRELW